MKQFLSLLFCIVGLLNFTIFNDSFFSLENTEYLTNDTNYEISNKQDPDDLANLRIDSTIFETQYDETTNEAIWYYESGVDIYSYLTIDILEECNLIFSSTEDFKSGTTYVVPQDVDTLSVGLNHELIIADMDEVSNALYGENTNKNLDYYAKIELILSDSPYVYYTDYTYVTEALYDYASPFLYDVYQVDFSSEPTRDANIELVFKYPEYSADKVEGINNLEEATEWLNIITNSTLYDGEIPIYNTNGMAYSYKTENGEDNIFELIYFPPYDYELKKDKNEISFKINIVFDNTIFYDSYNYIDFHIRYDFSETRNNTQYMVSEILIDTHAHTNIDDGNNPLIWFWILFVFLIFLFLVSIIIVIQFFESKSIEKLNNEYTKK